ncbi:hypothetical protein JQN58_11430 [Aneurinibacillus sp. BA2021]|nr:hypothetical protein [Aneurinibacillus sp. BA2021]
MRKSILFDKWVVASVLYVGGVIGGFTVLYDDFFPDKTQAAVQHADASHGAAENNAGNHGHEGGAEHEGSGEINTFVQSKSGELHIFLRDKTGNPVNDLEVNHEKLLHLMIVDEHLQKYDHLHPERIGEGEFRVKSDLPEGFYKAFIDIKPKGLAYHVAPVPFVVGSPGGSTHSHTEGLKADTSLTRNVDGKTVTLHLSSNQANQPAALTFDLDRTDLTPYLGAMGHVVILDENAQEFLHVHPSNDTEPVFETQFKKPGVYKIWAEFKQNGKVRAFPFVVEIKGED